jgi:hypothetical protein
MNRRFRHGPETAGSPLTSTDRGLHWRHPAREPSPSLNTEGIASRTKSATWFRPALKGRFVRPLSRLDQCFVRCARYPLEPRRYPDAQFEQQAHGKTPGVQQGWGQSQQCDKPELIMPHAVRVASVAQLKPLSASTGEVVSFLWIAAVDPSPTFSLIANSTVSAGTSDAIACGVLIASKPMPRCLQIFLFHPLNRLAHRA